MTTGGTWAQAQHRIRGMFGVRVLANWGVLNVARWTAIALWIGLLISIPIFGRPDLFTPTNIGSDPSNYVAAGQRTLEGNDLYRLSAGDRPTPADNPPDWNVAILSPPPIGVVWAGISLASEAGALVVPWAAGLAGMAATVLLLLWRLPPLGVLACLLVLPWLAVTAWSGNLNAIVWPALAVWYRPGSRPPWSTPSVALGATIALASLLKIGPLTVAAWVLLQRRWGATVVGLAVGVGVIVASLLTSGPSTYVEYLNVAQTSRPTSASIPGVLEGLGLPGGIARWGIATMLLAAGGLMIRFRHREDISFAIAVIAATFATPVVRSETAALVVFAMIPCLYRRETLDPSRLGRPRRSTVVASLAGLIGAVVVVGATVSTGALVRSSVEITNRSHERVVVRFNVLNDASFGFAVEPDEAGRAWEGVIGGSPSLVRIFDASCRPLADVRVPRDGGDILIDDDGALVRRYVADKGSALQFSNACAEEWPPPLR